MRLRPVEKGDLELVAGWLGEESNYKWLDFGAGRQVLSAASLALMGQRDLHCLRLFSDSEAGAPIGIVAISNIAKDFCSGTLWYVLGDKTCGGKGCTTRAVAEMMKLAFTDLALVSVNAWAVADNVPSVRVLEKNGFRLIGRQRRCHRVDGRLRDRLHFDFLADEYHVR